MIPKIIHYCWFGGKTKPQDVLENIKGWKKINPDYEIKEWNESNFNYRSFPYTHEAYLANKFAFVSDVCRLYALTTDGGIYLDTDVVAVKPFDELLHNHSFIGREAPFQASTAVIAAEKGCKWVHEFYMTYTRSNRHFITPKGSIITVPNTVQISRFLDERFPKDEKLLTIYDVDVLCAKLYHQKGEYYKSPNTVAIHEFEGSWFTPPVLFYNIIFQRLRFIYIRWFKRFFKS